MFDAMERDGGAGNDIEEFLMNDVVSISFEVERCGRLSWSG